MVRFRLRYLVLLLALGKLIGGTTVGWKVQRNFGAASGVAVIFPTAEGTPIRAALAVPVGAWLNALITSWTIATTFPLARFQSASSLSHD